MKHYYSESKGEYVPINLMATPHLLNTIRKQQRRAAETFAHSILLRVESAERGGILNVATFLRNTEVLDYVPDSYHSLTREARNRGLDFEEI